MQTPTLSSIYILKAFDSGWIIEKIIIQLKESLKALGFDVAIGDCHGYQDQNIVIHTRAFYYRRIIGAKNIVFVFHVDDKLKELEMVNVLRSADAIIAMSCPDKNYLEFLLVENNIDHIPIFDHPLPALCSAEEIRPLIFSYFSECYQDGRKNESWLLELANILDDVQKQSLILRFMGAGWGTTVAKLRAANVSCEYIDLNRAQGYEYQHQIRWLEQSDYLIYLGFDGGAMSVYDAIVCRLGLIITDQSFHTGLSSSSSRRHLIESKEEFFAIIQYIVERDYLAPKAILEERSLPLYAKKLGHFVTNCSDYQANDAANEQQLLSQITPKKIRQNYKQVSVLRSLQYIKRSIFKSY